MMRWMWLQIMPMISSVRICSISTVMVMPTSSGATISRPIPSGHCRATCRGCGGRSDVDVLVSFDGPATSERYFGVQFYLEDLLGRPVDLITKKALRAELRPYIEREAVRV